MPDVLLRFVLDTNIVVSAVRFPYGSLGWVQEAWRAKRIVPLLSSATLGELARVLAYPKFRLTENQRDLMLADYVPWCEFVKIGKNENIPECRDPSDVPFLELALSGKADAIVTGDQDLLVLAPAFPAPILAPREARSLLADA